MHINRQTKPSNKRVIFSLVFVLVTSLLAGFAIIVYSIKQVNQESRHNTESHVSAIIDDKLQQQALLTKDYSYWDDTIRHAYLNQNQKWIDENIGIYLTETFGISDLFIMSGGGEVVLALKHGINDQSGYLTINKEALTRLMVHARKFGPIPEAVSGIVMIDGTPALLCVSALSPENNIPFSPPRPVFVMATRMDKNYLQKLAKQFGLKELRFTTDPQTSKGTSSMAIKNPLGIILGKIVWRSANPGNLVLGKIQFPLIILLLIIIFITFIIIKSFRNSELHLQQAYADLEYNANHDALTNLVNRRLFNELLIHAIHSAKRDHQHCAMLYIDLDDFKIINDNYGHHAGDQLLIAIAERLRESTRESDIVARIGGDEFIVLLSNTKNREDIKAKARKILNCLTQPVEILNKKVDVGASIGITIIPDDGQYPDELLNKADKALYEGKNSGRNALKFYNEIDL